MGAQGQVTIDFGAFPGGNEAVATVTGQTGITADSDVEVWIRAEATADHSADEHVVEARNFSFVPKDIVAGTGFSIHGIYDCFRQEPLSVPGVGRALRANATALANSSGAPTAGSVGGKSLRAYGLWTVSWVWN